MVGALEEVVAVPAGAHRLGEPGEERVVRLAGVLIGRWPVMNAALARFAAADHPVQPRLGPLAVHPATGVTWQIVRDPYICASIAATGNFVSRQPRVVAEMLGKLLWWCGEDEVIYGGEAAIWHPQWALEAFWSFELPRDIVEERGCPPLPDQARRKILGENLARRHGIDVAAEERELGVPS